MTAATSVTGSPASRSARAVPPVLTSSKPRATRPRPRSASPALSETDRSARRGTGACASAVAGSRRVRRSPGPAVTAPASEVRDRGGQQPVLDRVEPLEERGLGVVLQHRDGLLGHDRAAVEGRVDEMDRDARDGDAGGEGVAHGVQPRERGEQARVDVEDPAGERGEHPRSDEPQVAGEDEHVGLDRGQRVREHLVVAARDEDRLDPLLRRPVERRAGAVGEHERDRRRPARLGPRSRRAPGGWSRSPRRRRRSDAGRCLVPAHDVASAYRSPPIASRRTTSPMTQAGTPRARARSTVRVAAAAGTMTTIPMPAVERRPQLVVLERADRAQEPHHGRHRPRAGVQPRTEGLRQRPWHVARQPAAGDVRHAADVVARGHQRLADRQHVPGIDPGRRQQHLAEGRELVGGLRRQQPVRRRVAQHPPEQHLVRPAQVEIVLRDERPHERVAVGVEARRGEPDDRVAGLRRRPVEQAVALGDADAEAGEIELVRLHEARVLGRLAADERTARLAAALRDARDELRDVARLEAPDRDVVEERERLGAAAHDVVRAHRDEVLADRVVPAQRPRDGRLRAHAIGRGHDHRLAEPGRDRDRGAEPAEAAQDLGAARRRDRGAHQLDRALPGIDVDAGARVRRPSAHDARRHVIRRPAPSRA